MLPALAAIAIGGASAERDYRVAIHNARRTHVTLRANVPQGWIAAFCTSSVCAPGHVVVRVPANGEAIIALHIYRVANAAPHRGNVTVADDRRNRLSLNVSL